MKQNKADSTKKLKGAEGFDSYYRTLYGMRWDSSLKNALLSPSVHAEFSVPGCKSYFLDPGSIVCGLCLPVKESLDVLDLCAAPGGKTLVLSQNLNKDAHLSSNERSPERKARLSRVVEESLPEELSQRITVSCSDGATWCRRQTEAFDSILLDAPCSSERHVLTDPKYLNEWSPNRVKSIAMEQWALLSSAWRLLKKGGKLLYSTCALAEAENDLIIERLIKKFDDVEICTRETMESVFLENLKTSEKSFLVPDETPLRELFALAESTAYGLHILPDTAKNAGPLFFCLISKK